MSLRSTPLRKVRAALVAAMVVTTASGLTPASNPAFIDVDDLSGNATFTRAGAPIFDDPVDGIDCLLDDSSCRSGARGPEDPPAIARSLNRGELVRASCALGGYDKIAFLFDDPDRTRSGWVLRSDLKLNTPVGRCGFFDRYSVTLPSF